VEVGPDRISVMAHPVATRGVCPDCGQASSRVHSRYRRWLLDLPSHGRAVQVRVAVRRFRCPIAACPRQVFTERLDGGVAQRSARRTTRLEAVVQHLGVALGGRPAASLARRLMLPVSKDTLLRVVRRNAVAVTVPLGVIGIDDFAWSGDSGTGPLSAIWKGGGSLMCCPIVKLVRSRRGFLPTPTSLSSRAIGEPVMAQRLPGLRRRPYRSPIAGISWRMSVQHSWMPCGDQCAPSDRPWDRRRSTRLC